MIAQPNFYPFEIRTEEMASWDLSAKVFNFFEIIQILDGKGERHFNDIKLPYQSGQTFIYTPQDCRSFTIVEPTRFLFIRFTDVLFANCESADQRERLSAWMKSLEYLFLNHNKAINELVRTSADCNLVQGVMAAIAAEASNPQLHSRSNIQHLLQVLLHIFARNILPDTNPLQPVFKDEPLINRLTGYIRKHIYNADQLRIEDLATFAGLSKNYIGEYFSKRTGVSIRQYILEYRLNLVKIKLQYSDLTVSEIAHELDFSDESHLSNLFKKYFLVSPTAFRKKLTEGQSQQIANLSGKSKFSGLHLTAS
ncbi:AraC-type DNA-binding protein [Mucilaginibacter gossypiicola]|uniref:AraC-type DNA-binding protein n=1 Tax=Mucilaginibacter gossypiicola TaxID=551995 RepID=A0A1H8CZE2_9SPHI|nr:AraC family transcriptional regulator [Mucilaginibacter gossypiicola]SEN00463.1 AraC-type DNA-binding protein [Mucilaginibacter gossypiicola]